eukprot:2539249-Pyramimonas_sp.AAC.1
MCSLTDVQARRLGRESPPLGNRFRFRVRVMPAGVTKVRGRAKGITPPSPGRFECSGPSAPGWRAV